MGSLAFGPEGLRSLGSPIMSRLLYQAELRARAPASRGRRIKRCEASPRASAGPRPAEPRRPGHVPKARQVADLAPRSPPRPARVFPGSAGGVERRARGSWRARIGGFLRGEGLGAGSPQLAPRIRAPGRPDPPEAKLADYGGLAGVANFRIAPEDSRESYERLADK